MGDKPHQEYRSDLLINNLANLNTELVNLNGRLARAVTALVGGSPEAPSCAKEPTPPAADNFESRAFAEMDRIGRQLYDLRSTVNTLEEFV